MRSARKNPGAGYLPDPGKDCTVWKWARAPPRGSGLMADPGGGTLLFGRRSDAQELDGRRGQSREGSCAGGR
jgi:hypothetical protein